MAHRHISLTLAITGLRQAEIYLGVCTDSAVCVGPNQTVTLHDSLCSKDVTELFSKNCDHLGSD